MKLAIYDHPIVKNGVSHKNREERVLAANIIRKWHVALKFCREQKGLSLHQLSGRVGISASELLRWEEGVGCPSGRQLPRLYASLPNLKAYKEYLSVLAIKTATMVEVARERANKPAIDVSPPIEVTVVQTPKPPPPPPPAKPPAAAPAPVAPAAPSGQLFEAKSFGDAAKMARFARGLKQKEAAQHADVSQSLLSHCENGGAIRAAGYLKLVSAFPELKDPRIPPPPMWRSRAAGYHSPPAPPIEAPAPEPAAPPPLQPTEPKALAPLPGGESLAVQYAAALDEAAVASLAAEAAQATFIELDDKAKTARERAEALLKDLQERARWKTP